MISFMWLLTMLIQRLDCYSLPPRVRGRLCHCKQIIHISHWSGYNLAGVVSNPLRCRVPCLGPLSPVTLIAKLDKRGMTIHWQDGHPSEREVPLQRTALRSLGGSEASPCPPFPSNLGSGFQYLHMETQGGSRSFFIRPSYRATLHLVTLARV